MAGTSKTSAAAKAKAAPSETEAVERPVSTDADTTVDVPERVATASTADKNGECGAKLADFNPLYRDDISCVLDPGHAGPHSDGVNGQWPNADPDRQTFDPAYLCAACYPQGWPSPEIGASAGCAHGTWTYRG